MRSSERDHGWAGARWFPALVALIVQTPAVVIAFHVGPATMPPAVVAAALGVAAALPLLVRARYPGPVVAAVGVLAASALALGIGPPVAAAPLAIAVVAGTIRGVRIWVWSTLAGVALVVPLVAFAATGHPASSVRPLAVALVLCFFVAAGEAFRARRERFREMSRDVAARRRSEAEAERLRIARELHDVLAHSLSQISVQAGVGLHLFDTQPEKARESLSAIKQTSGQALEEVRGVLGFLRQDGAVPGDETASRSPAPDLARLPDLVASFGRAGFVVTLDDGLGPDIPPAVQLAVYRIVQESLTNVVRHAEASRATVRLRREPGGAVATVVDDGRGQDPDALPGRGLTGMRERAELLGGTLVASPLETGGFRVEARLPMRDLRPGRTFVRDGSGEIS